MRSRPMDMHLPPTIASESQGIVEPIYLHLSVTDPETIAALSESAEGRDRQELALTALKIGILSLKAARGTVDGTAIRQEGDRLLGTLDERLGKHRELMDEALGGTLRNLFRSFQRRLHRAGAAPRAPGWRAGRGDWQPGRVGAAHARRTAGAAPGRGEP